MIHPLHLFLDVATLTPADLPCGGVTDCDWTSDGSGLSVVLRRYLAFVGILFLCGGALLASLPSKSRAYVLAGCGVAALLGARLLPDSIFEDLLIVAVLMMYAAVLGFAAWCLFRLLRQAVLILRRFTKSLHKDTL